MLPTGTTSRIESIVTADGEVRRGLPADGGRRDPRRRHRRVAGRRAVPPQQPADRPPHDIEATVCWMDERRRSRSGARTCSSSARGRSAPRWSRCSTGSTSNGLRRDDDRDDARAQRDRPRVVPHAPSRCWSTTTAPTARRAASSSSTRRPTRTVGRRGHPGPSRRRTPAPTWCATAGRLTRQPSASPAGHRGRDGPVHRACRGRASRRSRSGSRRPTCRAAATPSCSTATTFGTASTPTSASPTTTARRTSAGPARWHACSPSPARWRSSR